MSAFLGTDGLIALATLSAMEIVLGVDNVVFTAILLLDTVFSLDSTRA
jgi:predicted tellurium resistance membrane protein TerC